MIQPAEELAAAQGVAAACAVLAVPRSSRYRARAGANRAGGSGAGRRIGGTASAATSAESS